MLIDRRQLVKQLLNQCGNAAVITGLGSPTYDVAAAGDREENFYLWGAMGGAMMVGLGVALAQPQRRVIVVTGDGEALMGLGSFATIAAQQPSNLAVLILDNERFCETGGQRGLTASGTDLAAVAKATGIALCLSADQPGQVAAVIEHLLSAPGPAIAVAKINPEEAPRVLPSREGVWLAQRFRRAMGQPTLAS
ncbi:MAG TPA: thiamine pyrophosphate-dependent enzyme [Xanthomonadales bacterium]|nr:thiamine pyrophosphate-dependent enzyme [Xanthomonadales bacterium]